MFQEQNKNNDQQDPNIENIPVHTMKQDLLNADNPNAPKENLEETLPVRPVQTDRLTPVQKSSPFLNPQSQPKITPIIDKRPEPAPTKPAESWTSSPKPNIPQRETISQPLPTKSRKNTLILGISILIILLLAGGGYYFWTTHQPAKVVVAPEPAPAPVPNPEPAPQPTPPAFNTDKPNYLDVDTATPDAGTLNDALKSTIDKVSQAGIAAPVEFIIVDEQNNPIPFSVFAKSFGLKLSPAITATLAETFSLFIYSDQGNPRLGLAVDSKNDIILKSALTKEEKTLVAEVAPLFLNTTYTNPTTPVFSKSSYKGADIRYLNVVSPEILSIDYTVESKRLFIGTTKMTLRSMIDYQLANIGNTNTVIPQSAKNTIPTNTPDTSTTKTPILPLPSNSTAQ